MPRLPLAIASSAVVLALALAACGGKGAATGGVSPAASKPVDTDPYALLPPAALAIARFDAAALFGNPTIGSDLSALADSLVPLGDDAGFKAARDVQRVIVATYATSEGDVAAILTGHFDADRIGHATRTKQSAAIVAEPHGTLTAYHAGREAWCVLTATTLVAGTPEGVTLVLDRVAKGTLDRWEPTWMTATLETPTAALALAGDFASRPLAAAAIGAVNLPWVNGIRQVRGTGALKADELDVDLTLSYGTPAQAKDAEGGIQRSVHLLDVLGPVLGLRLQGFSTKLDTQDLRSTFGLDAQTLRTLLTLVPRLLPFAQ